MSLPILREDTFYKNEVYVSNKSGYVKNLPDGSVAVNEDEDEIGYGVEHSFSYNNFFEAYNDFDHIGSIVKYNELKFSSGLAFLEELGKVRILRKGFLLCSIHVSLNSEYGQTLVYLRKNRIEEPGSRGFCSPSKNTTALTTLVNCKEGDVLEVALLGPGKVLAHGSNILLRTT